MRDPGGEERYANIEEAFLQRMELFEGITILATNLRKNIDQAFLRRVQFAISNPFVAPPQDGPQAVAAT